MSNQDFVDGLMEQYARLQSIHPDVAKDILETAQIASQYFVRSERHKAILDEAANRVARGEPPEVIYREESGHLLETWPDADAYGVAIVMLRKVVFGEEQP